MNGLFQKARTLSIKLEETPMTLSGWASGFLAVLLVRFLLEGFSSRNLSGFIASDLSTNLHYSLFYLGTSLALAFILTVFSRVPVEKTIKIILFGLPVIWLAPLVDLAWSGGASMGYLFGGRAILSSDFLTFFGPMLHQGVTLGMRVEFVAMLLLIGGYVFLRSGSWVWALMGTLAGYGVIFLSVSLPSLPFLFIDTTDVLKEWVYLLYSSLIGFTSFHPAETHGAFRAFELLFNGAMMQIWYILVVLLGLLFAGQAAPRVLRAVYINIRPSRLMNYVALFGAGVLLASFGLISVHAWRAIDVITLSVGVLSLVFAWIFSVATNDLVDEPIDRVSNISRPLVTGVLSRGEMRDVAAISGALALIGALTLGSYSTYIISIYIGAYYMYSMPPLRLKRIPILASFLIALAHLASTMLGFFLVSGIRTLSAFPNTLALLIVSAFTLAVNAKDLKDIAGDRAHGIMTIPVLLGETWGRRVIGGMLFLGFLLIPIFLSVPIFFIPCVLAGLIVWVGVIRKMGEKFIAIVNIINLAVLVALYLAGF